MLGSLFDGDLDAADKVEALREFIGASLLGIASTYQRAFVFVGDGANGKSTILKIISALFSGELVTAISPQDMGQEYRRAMLSRSRLNIVSELPEADIMDSAAIKAIVSGDRITARAIRCDPFTFEPRCGNVFAANSLPSVRDSSDGFWRKWIVLEFRRTFAVSEQDTELADRIIATELDQIASWAIDSTEPLTARKHYTEPASSRAALAEWRSSADTVYRYLSERTKPGESWTPAQTLYRDYCQWCQRNGHKNPSSAKFGRRLKSLRVEKKRTKNGVEYARSIVDRGSV